MSIERKPVEVTQEPGYPSITEFVSARRSFMGLLGLSMLGLGGAVVLSSCQPKPAGGVRPVQPPPPPAEETKTPPAPPQVRAQPETRLRGDVAPVKPATIESDEKPKPQPPASPKATVPGDVSPVEPVKPRSRTAGE
jgi:hypothetical protein